MIIERVLLRAFRDKVRIDMELNSITVLFGRKPSGKSLLMKTLYRVLSSLSNLEGLKSLPPELTITMTLKVSERARREICTYFRSHWNESIDAWSGRVILSLNRGKDTVEYLIKLPELEEPLLHIFYSEERVEVRRPIRVELNPTVRNVEEIYRNIIDKPEIAAISDAHNIVRIVFEFILKILDSLRSIKKVYVNACNDFKTCIRLDEFDLHRDSVLALSASLLTRPRIALRLLSYLNQAARKANLEGMSIGIINEFITFTVQRGDEIVTCPDLPCSLKAYINLVVNLLCLDRDSILFIENFDYCLAEEHIRTIALLLREVAQRGCQVVLECRLSDVLLALESALQDLVRVEKL